MEVVQFHCSFPQRLLRSCWATHGKDSLEAETSCRPAATGTQQPWRAAGCQTADDLPLPMQDCKMLP